MKTCKFCGRNDCYTFRRKGKGNYIKTCGTKVKVRKYFQDSLNNDYDIVLYDLIHGFDLGITNIIIEG